MNGKATARKWCIALMASAAVLLMPVAAAHGELKYKFTFGAPGAAAGQFDQIAGVALNNTTGDVYISDRQNRRIQQFTSAGAFIRAWGYDVVASGEDDKAPVNEVQSVRVAATGGTFRLNLGGQTTGGLATATSPPARRRSPRWPPQKAPARSPTALRASSSGP